MKSAQPSLASRPGARSHQCDVLAHWESHRGNIYPLKAAAQSGQLLVVTCSRCHRTVHFLATDLIEFISGEKDTALAPFPCSRCGKKDCIRVTVRTPYSGDYGQLVVRRPGPVRKIQTWRDLKLGD